MPRPLVAPQRREQILSGLFRAIARKGFGACSVSDIARESGLPRGILHYYFRSKEEMLEALMRSLAEAHLAALDAFRARFDDPLRRVQAVLTFHLAPRDERSRDIARVWIEYWGYGLQEERVREVVRQVQAGLRRRLRADILLLLRRRGSTAESAEAMAALVLSLVEGPLLQRLYDDRAIPSRALLAEAHRFIEQALAPQSGRAARKGRAR